MLRRLLVSLTLASAICLVGPTRWAGAQAGLVGGFPNGGVDPFAFYWGYYLPHQAYIAAQPTPLDTINQITAARQFAALSDRTGLYDPISPYGEEELDPLRPYSAKRGGERVARPQAFAISPSTHTNVQGAGPALYYNRTARYFPHIRPGRGANRNLAVTRSRGVGGGGFGMSGMGYGGIGPR